MGDKPSHDEILSAIRSSGYLLEQQVADALEAMGYSVETNAAFRDPDQDKSREIDILASRDVFHSDEHQLTIHIELICECKASHAPIVFLGRNKSARDAAFLPREYVFPIERYTEVGWEEKRLRTLSELPAFFYFGLERLDRFHRSREKVVQFSKIIRDKGNWVANHDGLYNQVFFPLAKALLARQKDHRTASRQGWKHVGVFYPLVITTAPLYYLHATQEPLELEERPHISFLREVRSENVGGRFLVDFVQHKRLSDFQDNAVAPIVAALCDIARRHPAAFESSTYPMSAQSEGSGSTGYGDDFSND